uniref:RRM domain-containing protein n=1 Tax=Heterorhabditis bacteriophora TaxID=37862 RepID=A0A1I7WW69_HETBA
MPLRYTNIVKYIIDVQVVCNERGSKGFGFVTLDTKEACIRARAELHGRQVQGRVIEFIFCNTSSDGIQVRKATPMVAKKIGPRTVKTDSRFFPTSPSTAVPLQNTQTMSILQQQQIIANLLLAQNPLVVQTLLNQPAVGLSLLGMVPRLAPPPLMGNVISPLGSFGVGAMPLNNYGVASSLPQGFRCQPAVNVLNLPGSIDLLASLGVGVGLMPPQSTWCYMDSKSKIQVFKYVTPSLMKKCKKQVTDVQTLNNLWIGNKLAGKVPGSEAPSIKNYWEHKIFKEQQQKADIARIQRPKPYGFPKWRSSDALSASLVASNPVEIPRDSYIPKQRQKMMEDTYREAQDTKALIQQQVHPQRHIQKGKSLDSLIMQTDFQPW